MGPFKGFRRVSKWFVPLAAPLLIASLLIYYYTINHTIIVQYNTGQVSCGIHCTTDPVNTNAAAQNHRVTTINVLQQEVISRLAKMDVGGPSGNGNESEPENMAGDVEREVLEGKKNDGGLTVDKAPFTSYSEALKSTASKDRIIYLAFVDLGVYSMAMNFYITSIKKHNITNILFLSSSHELCSNFHVQHIPCFLYTNDTASSKESLYLSKDFIRKMNIRTFMVLDALKEGYSVIHTDVDMYFFADPLNSLRSQCDDKCDIAPLWDCGAFNAGFLYIRNTPASINVYKKMENLAKTTKMDDQNALNRALSMGKKEGLRVKRLRDEEFNCGMKYFEHGHRTFVGDNPCKQCMVVHNNWIVSTEAKVYRFKEMHMWMYDGDQYYSDTRRKYITYDNPKYYVSDSKTWLIEKQALINALAIGRILNRTVILPKFHCNRMPRCTLLQYIKLIHFDTVFPNSYRENTFLSHPLVPDSVIKSKSEIMLIKTDQDTSGDPSVQRTLVPKSITGGATEEEIRTWFSGNTESVLRFHSLYAAFSGFTDAKVAAVFQDTCKQGFQKTSKRQF